MQQQLQPNTNGAHCCNEVQTSNNNVASLFEYLSSKTTDHKIDCRKGPTCREGDLCVDAGHPGDLGAKVSVGAAEQRRHVRDQHRLQLPLPWRLRSVSRRWDCLPLRLAGLTDPCLRNHWHDAATEGSKVSIASVCVVAANGVSNPDRSAAKGMCFVKGSYRLADAKSYDPHLNHGPCAAESTGRA